MTQYLNTERVAEILCISKESARKFMREMPHICIGGKAHEINKRVRILRHSTSTGHAQCSKIAV